jgi:hypothetical protein
VDALVLPGDLRRRVGRVATLLREGGVRTVVVRGIEGSERLAVLVALARGLGHAVVTLDAAAQARHGGLLGPLCVLGGAVPVLRYDLGPGETAELPPLPGYDGPVGVVMGPVGGLVSEGAEGAVTLALPLPGPAERRRHWEAALGPSAGPDLDRIVEGFFLPGEHIRRVAEGARGEAALSRRPHVTLADVRSARGALNRQRLDTLAEHLPASGALADGGADPWSYLVVSDATRERLRVLERRCHHRERLLGAVGRAFDAGRNRGVRALFTGASGTGKTLAARLLAARLGADLFRVDLAAVVNKYIGETEKNLHRVLAEAEALDVVLLLDEGDALLGGRTDVRSANDRYANLETNYLLQRLEHYEGVVLITTNLAENVDRAFQRRMDVTVEFLPPQAEERRAIWRLHLPDGHAVAEADLADVAARCALTGGQIRNAALHAALLALDTGGPVRRAHLDAALRSEYHKAGATCPVGLDARPSRAAPVRAFLDTLRP